MDEVSNFVAAYKSLRELDTFLPSNHCAFRIDSDGRAPTARWVCKCLRTLMKELFPDIAHEMDYTDHCLRRGGETVLVYLNVDPKIQEQMGCWSKDSSARQLYMARILQTLVGIQRRIYKCDFDLMQDVLSSSTKGRADRA